MISIYGNPSVNISKNTVDFTTSSFNANKINSICYAKGCFYMTYYNYEEEVRTYKIAKLLENNNWEFVVNAPDNKEGVLRYGNGVFVYASSSYGQTNNIKWSEDLSTWTAATFIGDEYSSDGIADVIYYDGLFFGLGKGYYYSVDGKEWWNNGIEDGKFSKDKISICCGEGKIVASNMSGGLKFYTLNLTNVNQGLERNTFKPIISQISLNSIGEKLTYKNTCYSLECYESYFLFCLTSYEYINSMFVMTLNDNNEMVLLSKLDAGAKNFTEDMTKEIIGNIIYENGILFAFEEVDYSNNLANHVNRILYCTNFSDITQPPQWNILEYSKDRSEFIPIANYSVYAKADGKIVGNSNSMVMDGYSTSVVDMTKIKIK